MIELPEMAERMDRIVELLAEGKHVLWVVMIRPARSSVETMELVARALHDRGIDFTVSRSHRKIRVEGGMIEFAFRDEQVRGLRPDAVIGSILLASVMGAEIIP